MKLVRAVIISGLKRRRQPSRTACSSELPRRRSWRKKATRTTPFWTAMPSRAMNATAAETESGRPKSDCGGDPADQGEGQIASTRAASRTLPSAAVSSIITSSQGDRNHDGEAPHGALLLLELAAVLDPGARRAARR